MRYVCGGGNECGEFKQGDEILCCGGKEQSPVGGKVVRFISAQPSLLNLKINHRRLFFRHRQSLTFNFFKRQIRVAQFEELPDIVALQLTAF